MSDEDLELAQLKQQRLMELRRRAAGEEARARAETEKQTALRMILTPEARQRLMNIRMVRPEFADQLENQLVQLAQSGKVSLPITDEQLKQILQRLTSRRRDITITRV